MKHCSKIQLVQSRLWEPQLDVLRVKERGCEFTALLGGMPCIRYTDSTWSNGKFVYPSEGRMPLVNTLLLNRLMVFQIQLVSYMTFNLSLSVIKLIEDGLCQSSDANNEPFTRVTHTHTHTRKCNVIILWLNTSTLDSQFAAGRVWLFTHFKKTTETFVQLW